MTINILHRMRSVNRIVIGLMVCMSFASCNDFLDVDSNHAASEDLQWKTLEEVRGAMMGVYGLARAALSENNTHWLCGDLRYGDFSVYRRTDLQSIVDNQLSRTSDLLEEVSDWRRFYAVINAAAVFIEKAPQAVEFDKRYSEATLRLDIAQARALRAFMYFYMARIWGDVPLVTQSYDNGSFPAIPRTAAGTVLSYARGELLEVIRELPWQYGSNEDLYYGQRNIYWNGVLFDKLAGYALLAHLAAWEGNYGDAANYAKFVLDNCKEVGMRNGFTSVTDLTSPTGLFFEKTGFSKIFGFNARFDQLEATTSGHLESLTLASPLVQKAYPDIYVCKDSLYAIFTDPGDQRFGIDSMKVYNSSYVYDVNADIPIFSKVKVIQNGVSTDGDYAVFGSSLVFTRMEEIKLLYAEALVVLNRGEDACLAFSEFRVARGFPQLSYKLDFKEDKTKLLKAVFDERRRELMGEGWRWYDQIRCQKLLKNDDRMEELIRTGGIYWPVSSKVITANPAIAQNNYWN